MELTEKAESTLRDALEREKERVDKERERAEQLQAEFEEAGRPWWRKMFVRCSAEDRHTLIKRKE